MEYTYEIITELDNGEWIFITYEDWDEPEGFVHLVKKIQSSCNGKIVNVGWMRYKIIGAELDLVYQFDDLFGMVVEYPKDCEKEKVIEFLKKFF